MNVDFDKNYFQSFFICPLFPPELLSCVQKGLLKPVNCVGKLCNIASHWVGLGFYLPQMKRKPGLYLRQAAGVSLNKHT